MQPPPLPILKHKFTLSFSCATQIIFFLKSGTIPASFVYFHSFLIAISIIQIEESVDGALGNWTRGHRMVGTDETTELGMVAHKLFLPKLSNTKFLFQTQNWRGHKHSLDNRQNFLLLILILKIDQFPGSFCSLYLFSLRSTVIKFWEWLDSNRGPVVSELTFLPTESQSLLSANHFVFCFFSLCVPVSVSFSECFPFDILPMCFFFVLFVSSIQQCHRLRNGQMDHR